MRVSSPGYPRRQPCCALPATGHRKHPLSSAERFIILTFELLLKMFVAGIISLLQDVDVDTTSFSAQFVTGIIVRPSRLPRLPPPTSTARTCSMLMPMPGHAHLHHLLEAAVFLRHLRRPLLWRQPGWLAQSHQQLLRRLHAVHVLDNHAVCVAQSSLQCACGTLPPPSLCTGFGGTGLVLVATSESSSLATYFSVTGLSLAQSWFLVWPVLNGTIVFGLLRWNQKRKQSAKTGHPVDNVSVAELEWWSTHDFPPDADQEAVVGADGESRGGELEEQAAGAHTSPLYGAAGGAGVMPVPGAATAPAALPGAPSPGPGAGPGVAASMQVAPMPGSPSERV